MFSIAQKKRFENPEEIENCSRAQKKRFENPEQRELARQKAIAAGKYRKSIKDRCLSLIKTYNLTNIQIPNGRSSLKTFLDFEQSLLKLIP